MDNDILLDKLQAFFLEAMDIAWDGGDWYGCDIQNFAAELGLGHFDDSLENQFILNV